MPLTQPERDDVSYAAHGRREMGNTALLGTCSAVRNRAGIDHRLSTAQTKVREKLDTARFSEPTSRCPHCGLPTARRSGEVSCTRCGCLFKLRKGEVTHVLKRPLGYLKTAAFLLVIVFFLNISNQVFALHLPDSVLMAPVAAFMWVLVVQAVHHHVLNGPFPATFEAEDGRNVFTRLLFWLPVVAYLFVALALTWGVLRDFFACMP